MDGHEDGVGVGSVAVPRLVEAVREAIEGDGPLREALFSLVLFGSLVRGDYVPGLSDVDFLAVLRRPAEEQMKKLMAILLEATRGLRPKLVDIPWALVDDLRDPLHRGHPFKFLTFYQRDFLEHHVVVYGEEVVPLMPRLDHRGLAGWRAEAMLANLERFRGDPEMMRLQAGEAARFLAVMGGARNISKAEILRALGELGDAEALAIYEDYMSGVEEARPEEYYRGFVESRLRGFLSGARSG